MTLTELHNPNNGFLVKDTCIIGVEVFVRKSTHEKRVNQTVNLTTSLGIHQTGHMEVETHSPFRDADDAELVFTLLGRVLHFLNIRKVKDMNEQACKELQDLWDELVKFRYDLTWLEPRVQSALGMKSYVERAMEVEKLKENVVVLKLETERLEAKLVAAEDTYIIGVEIFVSKSMLEKQVNQTVNLIEQTKVQVPSPTPEGRGLINLETILPFSSESVFAAVGRVLYFLKTRKVKDMNAQACKDLQVLWDELQKFQFDLTWLEPHVQSALEMKSYAERAMQVQKLKDSLVVLKLETKKLEEKLVAAEFNLYVECDLLKAKGIKENPDSELGRRSWIPYSL
ncbi:unnamed protein product [Trifolium pratense]|uniref:Uncharacterized protein n=1 Tax=Trifolium pratense TaxID=57577 RepID=A0ACB0IIK0_TRIPR|nr:unnamed protein product [Trifolium pratense]